MKSNNSDSDIMRSFPHKKEGITKQITTSKLKGIQLKFQQAVYSGHGHVVTIFFELCEKIWGESSH